MSALFDSSCRVISFIVTRDRTKAVTFYRDVLGFDLIGEDDFAAVLDMSGMMLRISTVTDHVAPAHTVLGWKVSDIAADVRRLAEHGVICNVYPGLDQDMNGVWTAPGGDRVAWFLDPDGNNLSLTQFKCHLP